MNFKFLEVKLKPIEFIVVLLFLMSFNLKYVATQEAQVNIGSAAFKNKPNIYYVGCFNDCLGGNCDPSVNHANKYSNQRDIQQYLFTDVTMTNEICIEKCKGLGLGKLYAATQNG